MTLGGGFVHITEQGLEMMVNQFLGEFLGGI